MRNTDRIHQGHQMTRSSPTKSSRPPGSQSTHSCSRTRRHRWMVGLQVVVMVVALALASRTRSLARALSVRCGCSRRPQACSRQETPRVPPARLARVLPARSARRQHRGPLHSWRSGPLPACGARSRS